MNHGHTAESLTAFEQDIASEFNRGAIRSPVHLAGGNEQSLLEIFNDVRDCDYVAVQWRSHLHCLLKGVSPEELKAAIMAGRSITLNFPKHRILSSAIAGGHLPIALGIAWQIKREKRDERVYVFLGDMVYHMGIFAECSHYAAGHDLPVTWVLEDNGKSVCTDTKSTWGRQDWRSLPVAQAYSYDLPWPHSGAGKRVNF